MSSGINSNVSGWCFCFNGFIWTLKEGKYKDKLAHVLLFGNVGPFFFISKETNENEAVQKINIKQAVVKSDRRGCSLMDVKNGRVWTVLTAHYLILLLPADAFFDLIFLLKSCRAASPSAPTAQQTARTCLQSHTSIFQAPRKQRGVVCKVLDVTENS